MRIITILIYLIFIILGVSFAALNAANTQVNFYFKTIDMPVAVLVAIAVGIGILVGCFLFVFKYWRIKLELYRVNHKLKLTETEIKNLRSIPLHNQH